MTTNPYTPPRTDAAGDALAEEPAPKSFARRLSFLLAAGGFVGFWGPVMLLASGTQNELVEVAVGLSMLLAVIGHFLGMVIMFAAQRGRRLLPVLLNAVSLAIIAGVMILGLVAGKE